MKNRGDIKSFMPGEHFGGGIVIFCRRPGRDCLIFEHFVQGFG